MALRGIVLGTTVIGLTLGFTSLIEVNWVFLASPIVPLMFVASLLIGAQFFLPQSLNFELRGAIFSGSVLVASMLAVIFTNLSGVPYPNHIYLLYILLTVLVVSRIKQFMIIAALTVIWAVVSGLTGIVTTTFEDVLFVGSLMAFIAVSAVLLEFERRRGEVQEYRNDLSKQTLDGILESTHDAMFSVDRDGNVDFANGPARDWADHVSNSSLEKPRFWQNLAEEQRNHFEHSFYRCLEGESSRIAMVAPMAGAVRFWDVQFTPNIASEGAIISIRDQTPVYEQEQRLKSIEESTHKQTLNMVSHELNTPLMPILLTAHVLRKHFEQEQNHEMLQRIELIERNADRAIRMIGNLIDEGRSIKRSPTQPREPGHE